MFKLSRLLLAYVIAVPLALLLGILVSTPGMLTFEVIAMILFFLSLPLLLRWHHTWMILFWNSAFCIGFLNSQPPIWPFFATASFGIAVLNHIMFQKKFLRAPDMTRAVLCLGAIILFTAWYRGGIGVRFLGGSSYGGRYYIFVLAAIMGYFALTSEMIPAAKATKICSWFFLSGATNFLPNLILMLGSALFILYWILPSNTAYVQAAAERGVGEIDRITGLAPACSALLCYLLARYGIRGLFDWSKPWRLGLLVLTLAAAFFAGFRSAIMMLFLIFVLQFYFERLMRTYYLPIVFGLLLCGLTPVFFFSNSMPFSVQRAISFLPVNVNSDVLMDAKDSSEWRYGMWAEVWNKEVPQYLLIGKGYSVDPADIIAATDAARLGMSASPYQGSMVAEDYHSGPLSVLVPFGIPGSLAFLWVLFAGGRVLFNNYRYGEARMRRLNTVMLSYYLANCISFFFIFGALNSELYIFLGAVGLSVSLNGGVRKRVALKERPVAVSQPMAMVAG